MSQTILSERQFTEKYCDKSIEINPENEYKIVEDLFLICTHKGSEHKIYLYNAYKEYMLDPSDIENVIINYINSLKEANIPSDIINTNHIVPIIKDKNYISDLKKNLNTDESNKANLELVYQSYNEELIIIFAEDRESSISFFSMEDFRKTNIPMDSLLLLSIKNLKRILPQIQIVGDNGLFGLIAGGYYESSLILLNSLWSEEYLDVKGDIVIAIPTRDVLFVTGSEDNQGIESIRNKTDMLFESGSYFITKELFIYTGEKFEKY